jgi:hypothetical protein
MQRVRVTVGSIVKVRVVVKMTQRGVTAQYKIHFNTYLSYTPFVRVDVGARVRFNLLRPVNVSFIRMKIYEE